MEIPARTIEQLNEAKRASDRLAHIVLANQTTWSREQKDQLSLIFEMIKGVHDAMVNLVEAN